jgi:lipopolysaccharide export system ATP-binding protein
MPLLSVHKLSQTVEKKQLLDGIEFEAHAGKTVALLGPNGAGKTTLLKSIMGLYTTPIPTQDGSNTVTFDDAVINTWPIHQRVEHGLLYLPQHTSLFTHMTVEDNLNIIYAYHPCWKNQPEDAFKEEVGIWLTRTQLTRTRSQKAGTLSGGQKRKLEIVRSLISKPKMILLDEPFAGVDPKSIYELKQIFKELEQCGIGIVISDHHVDQLLSIAQTVYVILGGRVITHGSIKDILTNTCTKEQYLGNEFYQEIAGRFL